MSFASTVENKIQSYNNLPNRYRYKLSYGDTIIDLKAAQKWLKLQGITTSKLNIPLAEENET